VTFQAGGRRYVGVLSAKNQVDRVQTWIDSPVMGDMLVETLYRDYEPVAGGGQFPMHIMQSQGGRVALDIWVSKVEANVAVDAITPEAVLSAPVPPVRVESETIAAGVHYLRGGSHHSVAVEMRDHVVLIEAPLNEARSLALLAKIKELAPQKPVRFVVNTHHHFDHSGGLRTLVNEGATIVTHESNQASYQAAWAAPRTIVQDLLLKSGKAVTFQTFRDTHVLTDGVRTIELHRIANSPHHDGFAMVYLPAEKILIEGDAYTPGAASPPSGPAPSAGAQPVVAAAPPPMGPPPPPPSPTTINLYENIRRLKLDVATIAALHGPRLATMDDLTRAAGKVSSPK
jgi:glyoxylase-like metal-dependent hydrolase (beta-lactamase superfamily II)